MLTWRAPRRSADLKTPNHVPPRYPINQILIDAFIAAHCQPPAVIALDFDATDAPLLAVRMGDFLTATMTMTTIVSYPCMYFVVTTTSWPTCGAVTLTQPDALRRS